MFVRDRVTTVKRRSDRRVWSDLFASRHLIDNPALRARGLLGLWCGAVHIDLPLHRIRQALLEAIDQLPFSIPGHTSDRDLILERAADPVELPTVLRLLPVDRSPRRGFIVPTLLELGLVDAAREQAHNLPKRSPRQRVVRTQMIRLARSGVQGHGDDRRFIPAPRVIARFPPSLPAFVRCVEALLDPGADSTLTFVAEQLLADLRGADRQRALGHWALAQYIRNSADDAERIIDSIRYRSVQAAAGLALIQAALENNEPDTARRFLNTLPETGNSREAGQALIARQGDLGRIAEAPRLSIRRTLAILLGVLGPTAQNVSWTLRDLRTPAICGFAIDKLEEKPGGISARLHDIRRDLGAHAVELLWSAHLLRTGVQMADAAPDAEPTPTDTVTEDSEERRAFRDEQLSLSMAGWRRRRVLARACRAVLLARTPPDSWPIRLRTLQHIGGDIATNVYRDVLARRAPDHPIVQAVAVQLCTNAPTAGLRWLAAHGDTLSADLVEELIKTLAMRHRLPWSTLEAWGTLRIEAQKRLSLDQTDRFCQQTLSAWRTYTGGFPGRLAIEGAIQELKTNPARAAEGIQFQEAMASVDALIALPQMEMLDTLIAQPIQLSRLRWCRPPSLPKPFLPRGDEALLRVLVQLKDTPRRSSSIFHEVTRQLPMNVERQVSRALWEGECPPMVPEIQPLGHGVRLRVLRKRADLLTVLRFADPVSCCWQSTQGNLVRGRVQSIWKDPLSFVFHVERQEHGLRKPIGFVFGCLALLLHKKTDEGEVCALLNGLYLQRQKPVLRDRVLAGLEAHFSAIGVQEIGVANQYNGRGAFPERYRMRSRRLKRARALTN
ncbi:MAG: hypothetical protein AAFV53_42605, partial [Myxococcota bacterium]